MEGREQTRDSVQHSHSCLLSIFLKKNFDRGGCPLVPTPLVSAGNVLVARGTSDYSQCMVLDFVYCCVLVAIIQALSPYSQEYTKAVSG